MFHGRSLSGRQTFHSRREVFSQARSNMPRSWATRTDSAIADSTVMVVCIDFHLTPDKLGSERKEQQAEPNSSGLCPRKDCQAIPIRAIGGIVCHQGNVG